MQLAHPQPPTQDRRSRLLTPGPRGRKTNQHHSSQGPSANWRWLFQISNVPGVQTHFPHPGGLPPIGALSQADPLASSCSNAKKSSHLQKTRCLQRLPFEQPERRHKHLPPPRGQGWPGSEVLCTHLSCPQKPITGESDSHSCNITTTAGSFRESGPCCLG